ncbi:MAG: extracellular solute-binding protein [Pseudomonadota bacterium]
MSGPNRRTPTRRTVLAMSGAAAFAACSLRSAAATTLDRSEAPAAAKPRHALTVFGEPRHAEDFQHFDYVNPNAPKGGSIKLTPSSWMTNQNPTTFNTFNMMILRGDSPPFMELTDASLMVRGFDEPDAVYGLIAKTVTVDGKAYTFDLRPEATFTDGSPITADDVAFTFDTLKADGHPIWRALLRGLEEVRIDDERTATLIFGADTSDRLPPIVSALPILSKAYWTDNPITEATLKVPVTSGAYTVGDFRAGRFVSFRRRADDWTANVPSRVGHFNFDEVRVDFFRERIASFEAFKKGDLRYREEFTSRIWATEYNFPSINEGKVVRREFPDERPAGAQGLFINMRRKKFADPRTREALGYAFDFEWMNANLFYGAYERTSSMFMNSDLMATGEPTAAELELLEPFRGQVPDAVFGPVWQPPVSDGSGRHRPSLQRANQLLKEAGWRRDGSGLVNDDGERLTIELLYFQPTSERILQPYSTWLSRLNVEANLRLVESAQYQSRLNAFDFDLTTSRFAFAPTPGEEVREYWSSVSANVQGTRNLAGIADPVIDALTETMIGASSREEMVTAANALDRVMRLGFYWVPEWFNRTHRVAYWDEFGIPDKKPRYELPVATTWWAKEA